MQAKSLTKTSLWASCFRPTGPTIWALCNSPVAVSIAMCAHNSPQLQNWIEPVMTIIDDAWLGTANWKMQGIDTRRWIVRSRSWTKKRVPLCTRLNPHGYSQRQSFTRKVVSRITCSVSPITIRNTFKAEGCDAFSKFVSIAGGTDCDEADDVELEAESA